MTLKKWLETNWLVIVIGVVFVALIFLNPAKAGHSLAVGGRTFLSIGVILLTVFIFMGLFSVWVKEESIVKHLGEESGFKGLFYGTLIGTIFHGPQVSIFPFLKTLQEKGARRGVLVAIVSAFAIKIPMIPLELALMGLKFTIVHNGLLFATAPILAIIMDVLLRGPRQGEALSDG
jgi:uncharacterized membrane protein YraQ (UPF0718 family)